MADRGRPSLYTEELAARICERLALGESLNAICKDDDMPWQSTVYLWLSGNTKFSENYKAAREYQADLLADEVMDRVRDCDSEQAAGARVHLDGVKWFASVVAPRKYTPKQQNQLELSGNERLLS